MPLNSFNYVKMAFLGKKILTQKGGWRRNCTITHLLRELLVLVLAGLHQELLVPHALLVPYLQLGGPRVLVVRLVLEKRLVRILHLGVIDAGLKKSFIGRKIFVLIFSLLVSSLLWTKNQRNSSSRI